MNKGQELGTGG